MSLEKRLNKRVDELEQQVKQTQPVVVNDPIFDRLSQLAPRQMTKAEQFKQVKDRYFHAVPTGPVAIALYQIVVYTVEFIELAAPILLEIFGVGPAAKSAFKLVSAIALIAERLGDLVGTIGDKIIENLIEGVVQDKNQIWKRPATKTTASIDLAPSESIRTKKKWFK